MDQKCDDSYWKFVKKLHREYFQQGTDIIEIYDLMKIYSKEYMMPRELWDLVVEQLFFPAEYVSDYCDKLRIEICETAYYQFRLNEAILSDDCCNIPYKLLQGKHFNYDDRDIFLPHADLDYALDRYEKMAYSPPSKVIYEQYRKSITLFNKIMSSQNEEEKWIEALKEANDDLFVQQNVEFRLGKEITNKKLWKLYIAYLKEYNTTIMLHTYSKYCRFWLDDVEMKKEYENQVKIHGPISVPWTNLMCPQKTFLQSLANRFPWLPQQFQPAFETECEISDVISRYPRITKFSSCSCGDVSCDIQSFNVWNSIIMDTNFPDLYYTKNCLILQQFPFHRNVINYICKNANARVLQKLFLSCKEFFTKHPTPICYNLSLEKENNLNKDLTFLEESLKISHNNPASLFPDKFFIIRNRLSNPQMLSTFIPKIYRCEAKFLEIYSQELRVKDFNVLTEHGFVQELILGNVPIINEDGTHLPLEEVMKMVPNIRLSEINEAPNTFYTLETSHKLSQILFNNQIQKFILYDVNVEFDAHKFAKFIEKNAASNCKLKITGPSFEVNTKQRLRKTFYEIIQETIFRKWKPPHMPLFTFEEHLYVSQIDDSSEDDTF